MEESKSKDAAELLFFFVQIFFSVPVFFALDKLYLNIILPKFIDTTAIITINGNVQQPPSISQCIVFLLTLIYLVEDGMELHILCGNHPYKNNIRPACDIAIAILLSLSFYFVLDSNLIAAVWYSSCIMFVFLLTSLWEHTLNKELLPFKSRLASFSKKSYMVFFFILLLLSCFIQGLIIFKSSSSLLVFTIILIFFVVWYLFHEISTAFLHSDRPEYTELIPIGLISSLIIYFFAEE